ncbi:MAG: hypothetical protein ACR2NX_16995 [Chthoniobacterales bacterium]
MKRLAIARLILTVAFLSSSGLIAYGKDDNSIWIIRRADGREGNGTRTDPYDGGRPERLDALMRLIPPHTRIFLGAGTFITRGIQAKDGWRIRGRGKEVTTLRLADGTAVKSGGTNFPIISKYFDGIWLNYFELSDLTLDCNRAHQPVFLQNESGFALDAYLIAAKSAKITNVRVLGTWANPGEGFPCIVMHDGSSGNSDRIEVSGVENLNPMGYVTAISVADQSGGSASGFIRHCLVTDHKDGSGFGSGAWRNFEVAYNITENVAIPIVIDTHNYRNVRIHRNRFYGCSVAGMLANGGGIYERIRIYNNFFEMGPHAGPCINAGNARITGEVRDNVVVQRGVKEQVIAKGPASDVTESGNVIRRK